MSAPVANIRPKPDKVIVDIVDYVTQFKLDSKAAYETARHCLIDTLGCGLEALSYPACTKLLGPIVPGTVVPNGAKVPGTQFQLDPVQAAFSIGAMIRWLDFNDTWLAAEWGHPSDNLGGILAVADWLSRTNIAGGKKPLVMKDVLTAMIQAHEIQGCIALENAFNKVGLDHVVLVKVATTAVVGQLLGLSRDEIINAVSLAWVDGQALRTCFPAEFHAQTAAEAAMTLHKAIAKAGKTVDDIESITIRTHEAALRIIDKQGPLANPADRDHCIQYMVAVPLIFGRLTAGDYEDTVARDPRIDALRKKIACMEDKQFTQEYHDPDKRSIANAITVRFKDGRALKEVVVEYPIGHKRRRKEGMPLLVEKFRTNLARRFPARQQDAILAASLEQKTLEMMPVNEYVDLYVI